jgi:para-aminobenzoate synthetase component 1
VEVSGLFTVLAHRNVFQLVSTIRARLAPTITLTDLLLSTFPAGSMTGAPKIRAMTALHEFEQGPRGAYAGTFGYFSLDGSAELAMTIRTIRVCCTDR